MEISKTFRIEAAHRLPNVPAGHKCSRLHGHSFAIAIHVSGPLDPDLGWVMDYADLKAAFAPLFEQLARWVWQRLAPRLPLLSKVVVNETCTTACEYRGSD